MKKKLVFSILIVILLTVVLGVYYRNNLMNLSSVFFEEDNTDSNYLSETHISDGIKSEMDKNVRNEDDKDKLITKTLYDGKLRVFSDPNYYDNSQLYFEEVKSEYGIECLRKIGAYYYSIHKSNNGGYMYILYEYDKESNRFKSIDKAFLYKSIKKEEFDCLKIGKSTFEDVIKIDSEVKRKMSLDLDKGESIHTVSDGGLIVIKYKNKSRHYVVTDIRYVKPKTKSVFKIMLPEDFPNFNEKNLIKPEFDEKTLEIIGKVNNEEDKDKLILKKFNMQELENNNFRDGVIYRGTELNGMTIKEVSKLFDLECLRKNENYYYSVCKSDEGGYLYLLFGYNVNLKELRVLDSKYLYKNLKSEDFNTIKKGKSTLKDIQHIDTKAVCKQLGTGPESLILLSNGGYVDITYKIENDTVDNIVYIPPIGDKSVLKYVFTRDLPN